MPITIDDSRCAEGIKILDASLEFESYQWNGPAINETSSAIEVSQAGTYGVTVTDLNGCTKMGSVTIDNIEQLNVSIKGPANICPNGEATLIATPAQSYQWSTGGIASSVTINQSGNYTCLLYTSPSPRDLSTSRMPSSA